MCSSEKQDELAGLPLASSPSWTYIAATHKDYKEFSVIQDFIKIAMDVSGGYGNNSL